VARTEVVREKNSGAHKSDANDFFSSFARK
jgi:hypothetical protein